MFRNSRMQAIPLYKVVHDITVGQEHKPNGERVSTASDEWYTPVEITIGDVNSIYMVLVPDDQIQWGFPYFKAGLYVKNNRGEWTFMEYDGNLNFDANKGWGLNEERVVEPRKLRALRGAIKKLEESYNFLQNLTIPQPIETEVVEKEVPVIQTSGLWRNVLAASLVASSISSVLVFIAGRLF